MRIWNFPAVFAAGFLLAGCASITRGTDEPVTFDSDPPGAEMRSVIFNPCSDEAACPTRTSELGSDRQETVDRTNKPGPACVTPCTLPVKRSDDLVVTFTKAGYHPATVKVTRQVVAAGGAGVAGNILIGGAVGLVADAATGAATDHVPNPVKVTLQPIASSPASRQRGR